MAARAGFSIIHPTYGEVGLLEHDDIANAIMYAADNGADAISMSFGGLGSQTQKYAIDYAHSQGVVLVASAGNKGTDNENYPAAYDNVIAVAATAADDSRAYYSNYGFWVDVAAPGGDAYKDSQILSTVPTVGTLGDPSGYRKLQGTSMASPYVAGVAALILSKNPDISNEQARQILKQAVDIPGVDIPDSIQYIGTGRVNVDEALHINSIPDAVAKITSPVNGDLITTDIVDITGTATGESYVVQYGEGIYPTQWVEIDSGATVTDGVLASWDSSEIQTGNFVLRLVVSDAYGTVEDRVFFEMYKCTHEFLEGWPKVMSTLTKGYSSPAIGDLDGDGDLEVVIGGSSGRFEEFEPTVFAWHHNGEGLVGWPKYTDRMSIPGGFSAEGVSASPAIVDLDNDGDLEIIVGAWDGKVYIWHHDGTDFIDTVWPKQTGDKIRSSPAIGDLDKDGTYEIIIASNDGNLYAWHQDGTSLLPGSNGIFYSFEEPEAPPNDTPALADLDNDGDLEIIMTVSQVPLRSKVYAFDYTGSLIVDVEIDGRYIDSPVIGDLDNDGSLEIVVSCNNEAPRRKRAGYLLPD